MVREFLELRLGNGGGVLGLSTPSLSLRLSLNFIGISYSMACALLMLVKHSSKHVEDELTLAELGTLMSLGSVNTSDVLLE